MKKLLGLVAAFGAMFLGGPLQAAQVDEDTYLKITAAGPTYGRSDGLYMDSSYNIYVMVNGSEVWQFDADGQTIEFQNDIYLMGDTASEFKVFDNTTSEDVTLTFSTNALTIGSDTAVADVNFGTLDVNSDAFAFTTNTEFLDSPTNGEICLNGAGGTNNEDICLDLETTANAVAWNTNTGVTTMDLGGIDLDLGGGAGALTITAASSSIVLLDNSTTSLDIGSTGLTSGMRIVTTNDAEYVLFNYGVGATASDVAAVATLDASDCGKVILVTADADDDIITLPAITAVPEGCELKFMYTGADGGAKVEISPNSADAIHGSCTVAAAVDEFNGTDDNDINLTKTTANTGDTITLIASDADWFVLACAGIWVNP